ncbi:MAG: hypothetical protein E7022_11940 [Desulfovibrio desulfuricans]|jgi:surface carbohydrate biosynthesis protein (TIGR04326 family)|nr:hypothetical protein [Desulfovibrio desulfuricans]
MPAKECFLVIGRAGPESFPHDNARGYGPDGRPEGPAAERLVVRWAGWDAPGGEISLEARLRDDLKAIRAEHAAWAYETGRLRVAGREVQHHLRCGAKLSMWWCSLLYERHPKMTPGLYTLYKLRALERLMDAEGCTSLRVRGGDMRLRRSLKQLCAASRRMFAEEDGATPARPAGSPLRRLYAALPAPLRAVLRYAHWWWTVRRRLKPLRRLAPLPETAGRPATIVTYFPNVDMEAAQQGRYRSRYWEALHDALNRRAHAEGGQFVRWLFIRFPAPQLDFGQCIDLRDRFRAAGVDGASFHYLEEFLGLRDVLAAWLRYARLCLASWKLEKVVRPSFRLAGSRLNFWNELGRYWAESFRGWRCLERCLQHRAFQRYAALAGPQRWTLFPLENCPWERMLTQSMHEAGNGPVIGAQHSTIRPTDFRYFDDPRTFTGAEADFQPDAIRGNGQSACGQWREAGVPAERLGVVEALRYLYLADTPLPPPPTAATAPAPRRLLVVTSFFRDETEAHLALLARALTGGLPDGWEVRVKPHPYLPVESRLRALLGKRAAEISVADGPIADQLKPGVVVWASNSTTVTLEAAVRGLPVMAMLPADDFDLCPLQDVPGLPRTGTPVDVAAALARPTAVPLPQDYLELDAALPRWKELLGL